MPDDPTLFEQLRAVLVPHSARAHVKNDEPGLYYLEVTGGPRPEMFGAVMQKKGWVSFHYYPVYVDPSLLDGLTPALSRRMQGKSCFNFKRPDDPAVHDLAQLVQATADPFLRERQ